MQKEFWFKRDGAWSLQTKPMYKEYFFVATHDAAALDRALAQLMRCQPSLDCHNG